MADDRVYDIAIFFPPVFDFSMPYLSLPLLKGYLEREGRFSCLSVDLNQAFFRSSVESARPDRAAMARACKDRRLDAAIRHALGLQDRILASLRESSLPGWEFSLRKLRSPWDLCSTEGLMHAIQSEQNPFREFYDHYFDGNHCSSRAFGISLAAEDQILGCFTLAEYLKTRFPNIPVVLGGTLATRLCERIRQSPLGDLIDHIVERDGEVRLEVLLACMQSNQVARGANVAMAMHADHTVLTVHTDVSTLPGPDFGDMDLGGYFSPVPVIPTYITRGCFWGTCDFCAIPAGWEPGYRTRDISTVIDEISAASELHGTPFFRLVDENLSVQLLRHLCEGLLQKGVKIHFEAYCMLDKAFLDRDLCALIAEAGCRQLFFGLESMGKETLNAMKKTRNDPDAIHQILANTAGSGILNYVFVLLGMPNTPVDEEIMTVEYLAKNKDIHVATLGSFVADMHSPVHLDEQTRRKYGIELFDVGDMTTEFGYTSHGVDPRRLVRTRCSDLVRDLYARRSDLALASVLNDELRLLLAGAFGNDFARQAIEEFGDIASIQAAALHKSVDERIDRSLSARGVEGVV